MEGEIPTRVTSLDMDTNMKENTQFGMNMLYKAEITNYITGSIEFKENLQKLYTVVWEF